MVRKTLSFGKIDANRTGRKINLVTVQMELTKNKNGFPVFSASARIWNGRGTDSIMGGQIFDEIKRVPENNALFQEIKTLWRKYHLNDLNAGTTKQIAALRKAKLLGASQYTEGCQYLKSIGLYEVRLTPTESKYNPEYAGKPYVYGRGWLYTPIPANDLAKIKRIMGTAY